MGIDKNKITHKGMENLRQCYSLTKLKTLALSLFSYYSDYNDIGDRGCRYLAQITLPSLTDLQLSTFSSMQPNA